MRKTTVTLLFLIFFIQISEILTLPINYGASLNSVHSDDLSAEDYQVLRKNETKIE